MRWILVIGALLFLGGVAHADRIDMGTWDCSGSKVKKVTVEPGEHDYVWKGSCGGAEGFDVVVTPRRKLKIKMTWDTANGELRIHVINRGKARKVKMHVFVGFA